MTLNWIQNEAYAIQGILNFFFILMPSAVDLNLSVFLLELKTDSVIVFWTRLH